MPDTLHAEQHQAEVGGVVIEVKFQFGWDKLAQGVFRDGPMEEQHRVPGLKALGVSRRANRRRHPVQLKRRGISS